MNYKRKTTRSIRKQKGLVAVLITVAFSLMLGFAALAIDVNDVVLNKAKLQNAVDAAAIAAAEQTTINDSESDARDAATSLLDTYDDVTGNTSLSLPTSISDSKLTIQFSNQPDNFSSGTVQHDQDVYVRVEITAYPLQSYFLGLFGIDKSVTVSAVAGPIYTDGGSCNIVPIGVCSLDDSDPSYGYTTGKSYGLKLNDSTPDMMGPGNFQLLDMGTVGGGGDEVELGLAGGSSSCLAINDIPSVYSKPGNTIGPVKEGVNVRFGDEVTEVPSGYTDTLENYNKAYGADPYDKLEITDYGYTLEYDDTALTAETYQDAVSIYAKSDDETNLNTEAQKYNYWGYSDYLPSGAESNKSRRIIVVPIINCDSSGGKSLYQVKDFACFFLLNRGPKNDKATPVIGQRIENCVVNNGTSSGKSGVKTGAYKIVLYKDPLNEDS